VSEITIGVRKVLGSARTQHDVTEVEDTALMYMVGRSTEHVEAYNMCASSE